MISEGLHKLIEKYNNEFNQDLPLKENRKIIVLDSNFRNLFKKFQKRDVKTGSLVCQALMYTGGYNKESLILLEDSINNQRTNYVMKAMDYLHITDSNELENAISKGIEKYNKSLEKKDFTEKIFHLSNLLFITGGVMGCIGEAGPQYLAQLIFFTALESCLIISNELNGRIKKLKLTEDDRKLIKEYLGGED